MNKAAKTRWLMRVASVLFALILWYFVTWGSSGLMVRKFSVPLRYEEIPDGYSISKVPDTVEVDLEGRLEAFAFLNSGNISASVGMSGLKPGKYSLPIQLTAPGNVRVVSYSPKVVEFELNRMIERSLRPALVLSDSLPDNLTLASADIIPAEVIVKGPETAVMALRKAEIRGTVREMTGGERDMNVILTDENGDVSGLVIEPPVVKVTAHFSRTLQEARIPIKVDITGAPPKGLKVGSVLVSPDFVTLRGAREALLGVTEMTLNPIDVTGHTDSMNVDIPFEVPSDAITIVGPKSVNVKVDFRADVDLRTYVGVAVNLDGVADTSAWSVSPHSVNVTVELASASGASFKPEKPPLELYIDATNVVASQITLPIMTRNTGSGVSVIRIEPSQVTLTSLKK